MPLVASCDRDLTATTGEVRTMQVKFTLAMDGGSSVSGTRAGTWGGTYDSEEEISLWENKIDLGGLQVLVYAQDPADTTKGYTFASEVKEMLYDRRTENEDVYDVTGSIDVAETLLDSDGGLTCKLVALANCPDWIHPSEGDGVAASVGDVTFSNVKNVAARKECIPMWGVRTYREANTDEAYKPLKLVKGESADAGTIHMLRAMAKIRVHFNSTDETTSKYEMCGASLSYANASGYAAPTGHSTVISTTDAETDGGLRALETNCITDLEFIEETEGSGVYCVYVPEMTASTGLVKDAKVTVRYAISGSHDIRTGTFSLDSYTATDGTTGAATRGAGQATRSGDQETESGNQATAGGAESTPATRATTASDNGIDIVRNTIYDYEVTLGKTGFSVTYSVEEWNVYESNVGWAITPTIYAWKGPAASDYDASVTDATTGDGEAAYGFVCYPTHDERDETLKGYKDESSTADFYFLCNAPEGARWVASLSNDTYFEFAVDSSWTDEDGTSHYCAATGTARETPYKISIRAKHPWWTLSSSAKADSLFKDSYHKNTSYGDTWEASYGETGGPYTDLYIYLVIDGERNEYSAINSADYTLENFNFVDGYDTDGKLITRRFASGAALRIRIWQLKARGESYEDTKGNKYYRWIGYNATASANTADTWYYRAADGALGENGE